MTSRVVITNLGPEAVDVHVMQQTAITEEFETIPAAKTRVEPLSSIERLVFQHQKLIVEEAKPQMEGISCMSELYSDRRAAAR